MIWNSRSARLIEFLLYHSGLGMLTGCWQQAFSIRRQHFNRRGFPMMFSRSFAVHAGFVPPCRIKTLYRIQDRIQNRLRVWALERVVCASSSSDDLRWMAAALAVS